MDPEKIAAAIAASVQAKVERALAPLLARLDALEAKEMPDLVGELLASDRLKTLVNLEVVDSVAEYMAENPAPAGKDGADGKDGATGDPGRDGLDLKDLFRAEGGRLVAVMSDGTTKDLGVFVGKDGRDGLGFEDMMVRFNDDHTFTLAYQRGDEVKEYTSPQLGIRHKGYWREGVKAVAGDLWVHAGTCWVAKADTDAKPATNAEAWQIFASKGSMGEPGRAGKDFKPSEPIKVRHD